MILLKDLDKLIRNIISYYEIVIYIIILNIIFIAVGKSSFIYFKSFFNKHRTDKKESNAGNESKILLGKAIGISLSFILTIEILKIFWIKTYSQLIILGGLILIKIIIYYYLENEISRDTKEIKEKK